MKTLCLDLIRTDGGTQMRAELNQDTFMEYREVWKNSPESFPPLVVFHDGSQYWLADGFHRFYGAREAKRASVPVDLRQGTVRDAILFAAGANDDHGLRRSPEDKKNSVRILLEDEEWKSKSSRWIAETCKIGHPAAEKYRKEIESESTGTDSSSAPEPPKPRTGKDGKKRKSPKKKPTKKLPSQSDQPSNGAPDAPEPPKNVSGGVTFDPAELETAPATGIDLVALAAPYKQAVNDLNRILRDFKELAADECTGAYLVEKINRINKALDDAKTPIAQATPTAICGKCDGKKCKSCSNTGWWPKSVVEGMKK